MKKLTIHLSDEQYKKVKDIAEKEHRAVKNLLEYCVLSKLSEYLVGNNQNITQGQTPIYHKNPDMLSKNENAKEERNYLLPPDNAKGIDISDYSDNDLHRTQKVSIVNPNL